MSSTQATSTMMDTEPTTSTPEVPGMVESIRTLQSDFWKMPKPSIGKRLQQEFKAAIGQVLGEIASMGGPDIGKIVLTTPLILKNLQTVPDVPSALVSAAPFVQKMRIDRVLADLETIPEGKALADMVRDSDSRLSLNARLDAHGGVHQSNMSVDEGRYVGRPGEISVSAYMTHGTLTHVMVHELQHRRQLLSGVLTPLHEKVPSPLEALWYDRAIEADAEATAADISFKLMRAGKPAAWESMKSKGISKAAEAYERAVLADPDAMTNGTAKRAAFDSWFEAGPQRIDLSKIYNGQGMSKFVNRLQLEQMAEKGVPFEPLREDDIKKLGTIDKSGINYLDLPGQRPLTDAFYRKPNWNAYEAGFLGGAQRAYEEIKASQLANPDFKPQPPLPIEERVKRALPQQLAQGPLGIKPPGLFKPPGMFKPPAGPKPPGPR